MEKSEKAVIRAASSEVSHEIKTLMNAEAMESLKQTQHLILGRLQDSNAVLSHFNEYSENCYADVMTDFSRNTSLLKSMKTDLDYIFLKLRSMKSKISATYPDALPNGSLDLVDTRPDLDVVVCDTSQQDRASATESLEAQDHASATESSQPPKDRGSATESFQPPTV